MFKSDCFSGRINTQTSVHTGIRTGNVSSLSSPHFRIATKVSCNSPFTFPSLLLHTLRFLREDDVRLVFLLLSSLRAWRLLPAHWYVRWGGPSGRAHPCRLCQSILEQRPAFSHSAWKLRAHTRTYLSAEVHCNSWTIEGYFFCFQRIRGLRFTFLIVRWSRASWPQDTFTHSHQTPRKGPCLDLFWSKSTSLNKSQTTVNWNVRMVS